VSDYTMLRIQCGEKTGLLAYPGVGI